MDFLEEKNFRIYIQKNTFSDIDFLLYRKLKKIFLIEKIKIYHIYDFFKISKKLLLECILKFLADPVIDNFYLKKKFVNPFFEFFSKKNDERSEATMQCIKILDPSSNVLVKNKSLIELIGLSSKSKENIEDQLKDFFHNSSLSFDIIFSFKKKEKKEKNTKKKKKSFYY